MAKRDYYDILGINKSSSKDEIKKAYRTTAFKYHPDKIGGNTLLFQQLHDYYQEILIKNKNKLNENIAKEEVRNRYRNKSDTSNTLFPRKRSLSLVKDTKIENLPPKLYEESNKTLDSASDVLSAANEEFSPFRKIRKLASTKG